MVKLNHSLEWHWKRVAECAKRAEAMPVVKYWIKLGEAEVKKNGRG